MERPPLEAAQRGLTARASADSGGGGARLLHGVAMALALARVALASGQEAAGARLLGAAVMLRDGIGATRFHDQGAFDGGIAKARAALGEHRFEEGFASGRAMTLEEVLDAIEGSRLP